MTLVVTNPVVKDITKSRTVNRRLAYWYNALVSDIRYVITHCLTYYLPRLRTKLTKLTITIPLVKAGKNSGNGLFAYRISIRRGGISLTEVPFITYSLRSCD